MRLIDADTGSLVVPNVTVASSFRARLRGLLGSSSLAEGSALWLLPCTSVHTLGMRYAIDVVLLDRRLRVLSIRRGVAAGRLCVGNRRARSVLELAAGQADALSLAPGMYLQPG